MGLAAPGSPGPPAVRGEIHTLNNAQQPHTYNIVQMEACDDCRKQSNVLLLEPLALKRISEGNPRKIVEVCVCDVRQAGSTGTEFPAFIAATCRGHLHQVAAHTLHSNLYRHMCSTDYTHIS